MWRTTTENCWTSISKNLFHSYLKNLKETAKCLNLTQYKLGYFVLDKFLNQLSTNQIFVSLSNCEITVCALTPAIDGLHGLIHCDS